MEALPRAHTHWEILWVCPLHIDALATSTKLGVRLSETKDLGSGDAQSWSIMSIQLACMLAANS